MEWFKSYKKELLSGLFGALLSAVIALITGLYNMNRQFEIAHLYELRTELKKTLEYMRFLDKENDFNISLMIGKDLVPEVVVKKLEFIPANSDQESSQDDDMDRFLGKIVFLFTSTAWPGGAYRVESAKTPSIRFRVLMADNVINAMHIDFSLRQDILRLYRKLAKINHHMDILENLAKEGSIIAQHDVGRIEREVEFIRQSLESLSSDKKALMSIKNGLRDEIELVEKKYVAIDGGSIIW